MISALTFSYKHEEQTKNINAITHELKWLEKELESLQSNLDTWRDDLAAGEGSAAAESQEEVSETRAPCVSRPSLATTIF